MVINRCISKFLQQQICSLEFLLRHAQMEWRLTLEVLNERHFKFLSWAL
jgi:hypothetical protein